MTKMRLLKALLFYPLLFIATGVLAQTKALSGNIRDAQGAAIPGANIQIKGTSSGTVTDANGAFKLSAPASATTLIVSFIGYLKQEVPIGTKTDFDITLQLDNTTLADVVVVGYGIARKKDLTGAVASLKAKDFNRGITNAPDQLIQGKVAGLMVVNNSGAPGAATTVRIRGVSSVRSGNQPLYVIDGVPLDGRIARPGINTTLGTSPDANPLNFVNAFDIAGMEVLKDASATAIYGSRGSNGVIMITTKKGQPGPAKLDFGYSVGVSSIMKKLKVLDAGQYKSALQQYGLTGGDEGGSADAMDAILRKGITQNFNVGVSGGNETGKYRASFGLMNQEGIIRKTGMKKYTGNITGQYKFLESKKLGLDFNVMASHTTEQLAPISNNAGYLGSLVGQALQWNPTRNLRKADGSLNILEGDNSPINPLAMSEAWEDKADISYILGSISPYYKITDDLEYRFLFSINRQTGIRRAQIASFINIQGIKDLGIAYYGNAELTTKLFTHTLSYNKKISAALNLNAVVGYEYQDFNFKGADLGASGFSTNAVPYTSILQNAAQSNTFMSSYENPSSELQSVFGRVTLNLKEKYLLTATLRADGSNKFGKNNRYGYFPSFGAKWNISNEDFMKNSTVFKNLALRAGWGQTGNQEFPAGAAQEQYDLRSGGAAGLMNVANPDLKWESSKQLNIGVDFSVLDNRISGNVDYFNKNTSNLLFNFPAIAPAPATNTWVNLPGEVINKGVEVALRGEIVRGKNFSWMLGANATFIKNELKNYTGPNVLTGSISGQGVSGATVQRFANGQPLNVFYVRRFKGLDKDGLSIFEDNGNSFYYSGDPNPKQMLGLTTEFGYKKWFLSVNMNGAFGHKVYNNTANTVLPITNLGSRNVALELLSLKESRSNPITTSTRYLENGNFMKLTNATLSYSLGNIGKSFKNVSLYVTGQNLFVITKYSGFDPEVNTDKNVNGVTSFGIEYSPYPTARNVIFGINLSL